MIKVLASNQSWKLLTPNLINHIRVASKLTGYESIYCKSFSLITRNFHLSNVTCKDKGGRILPTIICFQNPLTWIMNKLDFKMLKTAWDSNFEENEFKRGTKQAISVICCSLSQGLWDNLRGLVTKQTLIQLQRNVERNWSSEQKKHMCIEPSDIKLVQTKKVHFTKISVKDSSFTQDHASAKKILSINPMFGLSNKANSVEEDSDQRFADIDMAFIILKFKESDPSPVKDIIFFEVFARFHRNYTVGQIPNWIVSQFKIGRFHIRQTKDL